MSKADKESKRMVVAVSKTSVFASLPNEGAAENVLLTLPFGTSCLVVDGGDALNGYYKITAAGVEGFVAASALAPFLHEPNMVCISPSCALRTAPYPDFPPVLVLPEGALLDVGFSPSFPDYGFVLLPDKRIFYVDKRDIAPLSGQESEKEKGCR